MGFQTSSTKFRRIFPGAFFDLIALLWARPASSKNKGSSPSGHLNQSLEVRGVCAGGTVGAGNMDKSEYFLVQKSGNTVEVIFGKARWGRMGGSGAVIAGFPGLRHGDPWPPVFTLLCGKLPPHSTSLTAVTDGLR